MLKRRIILLCIFLSILIPFATVDICSANSAEPPSIIIIVPNAPEDLEITIGEKEADRQDEVFESYFSFYSYSFKADVYTLTVTNREGTFEITTDTPLKEYNNVYTLDLDSRTLTVGELPSRNIMLVTVRVLLTLLLEGLVFFLFGYRQKISWIIFLAVNLITQGALFICLNSLSSTPLTGVFYIIMVMIFAEILIFVIEMIVFLVFIKEHRRLRTAGYVLTANLLSLFLGGYLITALPL